MQSYARALSQNAGEQSHANISPDTSNTKPNKPNASRPSRSPSSKKKRSPSPSHRPKTNSSNQQEEEQLYVLTLKTDKPHHDRMTALRNKYFPRRINKLEAHLTLFHALPGSLMESQILPVIQTVAEQSSRFRVHAAKPIRLKRGIAIAVPNDQGGQQAREVHEALLSKWKPDGFLSEQDSSGGFRAHYTIMNKVDEESEIETAFGEVCESWKGDWGVVEGLALWKYVKGWWHWEKTVEFGGGDVK